MQLDARFVSNTTMISHLIALNQSILSLHSSNVTRRFCEGLQLKKFTKGFEQFLLKYLVIFCYQVPTNSKLYD